MSTEPLGESSCKMLTIEKFSVSSDEATVQFDSNWHERLDELVRGECSEEKFMDEISALREATPASAWNVIALLGQRYRRGQMPIDLFRSIESKIARGKVNVSEDGMCVDLITQRMGGAPQAAPFALPTPQLH